MHNHIRHATAAASALLFALLLAGCSSDAWITGGDLVRAGEATGTLTVINGTSVVLDAISVSECSASTYGLNRLPDGVRVGPGESYSFTVSAGCWDVAGGAIGVGDARNRLTVEPGGITELTINE